jgi:hypothetical protein
MLKDTLPPLTNFLDDFISNDLDKSKLGGDNVYVSGDLIWSVKNSTVFSTAESAEKETFNLLNDILQIIYFFRRDGIYLTFDQFNYCRLDNQYSLVLKVSYKYMEDFSTYSLKNLKVCSSWDILFGSDCLYFQFT